MKKKSAGILVYKFNNQYGEHGIMKKMAARRIPKVIKIYSRKIYY